MENLRIYEKIPAEIYLPHWLLHTNDGINLFNIQHTLKAKSMED